jgi:hypothetical protein
MADSDFDAIDPPYYRLEEALDWIEYKHLHGMEAEGWQATFESMSLLEKALVQNKLTSFASFDASAVQEICPSSWTEFSIYPALPNGEIWTKEHGDIGRFVVRSFKAYRAAALNDLSQPAKQPVPGAGQLEPGYYRVLSEIVLLQSEVQKVFPSPKSAGKFERPKSGEYAAALREIEGGKYFDSPTPHTPADIARMVWDHFKAKKKIKSLATVVTGISRHYRSLKLS